MKNGKEHILKYMKFYLQKIVKLKLKLKMYRAINRN